MKTRRVVDDSTRKFVTTILQNTVFWEVTTYSLVEVCRRLEEHTVYIFRADALRMEAFLCNSGKLLPVYAPSHLSRELD
jgi:hypothetical protein